MRSIKLNKALAFALLAVFGAAIGCGPSEEPAKKVENAQKGEGASQDGAANQSGSAQEAEVTQ